MFVRVFLGLAGEPAGASHGFQESSHIVFNKQPALSSSSGLAESVLACQQFGGDA